MTRPARSTVEVKNWVTEVTTEHQIAQQARIIRFLLWAYGCLLAEAMAMFFLQGFRLWGFQLDSALIQWLGAATIGEVGGLLTLTFAAIFKKLG